jgi:hypothetical protein
MREIDATYYPLGNTRPSIFVVCTVGELFMSAIAMMGVAGKRWKHNETGGGMYR